MADEIVTRFTSDFRTSEAINELAAALAKAQGVMKPAIKSAKNPFFKSSYADLGAVMDVIQKPFADNGLAVIQGPFNLGDGRIVLRTRLLHSSGQWIESALIAEAKDMGPQAIGSVVTYLRRYGVSAMAGVSTEDDDGEGAERPEPTRDATAARPPAQNWKVGQGGRLTVPPKATPPAPAAKPPNTPGPFVGEGGETVCVHGVSAPNRCLECIAHDASGR